MINLHPPLPKRPSPMPRMSCWVLLQWVCLWVIVFQLNPKCSVRRVILFRMNSKTCVQDSPPSPVRSTLKIFLPPPAQAYLCVVDLCGFPSSNEDYSHPATSTWSGDSGHRTHFEILLVTWIEYNDVLFTEEFPPTGISWIDSAPSQLTEPQSTLGLKPL